MDIKQITKETYKDVVSLFNLYRIFYKQPSNIALAENFIKNRVYNQESVIFICYDNDKIPVGFTQLYPSFSSVEAQKKWILNDLYVLDTHRGNGIARKLIETAILYIKNDDSEHLSLETAKDNFVAKKLYEKIGFKLQKNQSSYDLYNFSIN